MSLKLFQRYGVGEARASSTFGSFSSSEAKTLCLLYLNSHEVSCRPRDGNPHYLHVATSRGLKPSSIMQGASHELSCPARDGNPDYLQVATSRGLKPSSIMPFWGQ